MAQRAAVLSSHLAPAASAKHLTRAEVLEEVRGDPYCTIVGFGSLLSKRSALGTCPGLRNFHYGRVRGWRRVFRHPAPIFFERGIARPATKEISSLVAEPAPGPQGFVVCAFEVPAAELPALLAREEEFNFALVPYWDPEPGAKERGPLGKGWMCVPATDAEVYSRPGMLAKYKKCLEPHYGFVSVWDKWGRRPGVDGLLPCPVYCRHCVLAATGDGVPAEAGHSFLDETFLSDRSTTLREYLARAPHVMESRPPPSLIGRYSG
eukprot:TRINITY_DN25926_c0_g1_i1.p1 TRINITY_DN25926_c0_g1~~TRINITY_DN25926_c0_g1_i1.p1  ORF type:complete len:295 (+),score=90.53 TRINITY_DN25926_c0_g1_i1:94-885(+)